MTCHLAHDMKEAEQIMQSRESGINDRSKWRDDQDSCIRSQLLMPFLRRKILEQQEIWHRSRLRLDLDLQQGKMLTLSIETMRGHRLGRIIKEGSAIPNTGIPGVIKGFGKERVIHSPAKGILRNICHITDMVSKGQLLAKIETPEGDDC